jgi:hypothetical protein
MIAVSQLRKGFDGKEVLRGIDSRSGLVRQRVTWDPTAPANRPRSRFWPGCSGPTLGAF